MAALANKLVEGETIVELNPAIVDASFVQDRFDSEDDEFAELLTAIRDHGQESPILVRPHPSTPSRYMVVFGHRRLKVAKLLGRKVRAVVKEMLETEHVIAQGQENSARANLSFIEKASFAASLVRLRYDEDNSLVLKALGIDRATLSKMLSVATLPENILGAIGAAKGIGRDRWYELKLLLENPAHLKEASTAINGDDFASLTSDQKFNALMTKIKSIKKGHRARSAPAKRSWAPVDGALTAEMTSEGKRFVLAIRTKEPSTEAFGDYLSTNLSRIYEEFRQDATSKQKPNGD
jgi:ParB family chromosome partitioning protein